MDENILGECWLSDGWREGEGGCGDTRDIVIFLIVPNSLGGWGAVFALVVCTVQIGQVTAIQQGRKTC